MSGSLTTCPWKPPLPLEQVIFCSSKCHDQALTSLQVVSPGLYTPQGYLEQSVRLAQLTKDIRHKLYTGPIQEGQGLSLSNFEEALKSLETWLHDVPLHLSTTAPVPDLHRRPVAMLHLRYWSTVMLITRPFLLCNLLRGDELHGTPKKRHFDRLATTCASAASASLDIFEGMAYEVLSSLVLLDFLYALQVLQVILVASSLYPMVNQQGNAKRCISILKAISAFGFPKHMLPEILLEAQQFGLLDDVLEDQPTPRTLHGRHVVAIGNDETNSRYVLVTSQISNARVLTLTQGRYTIR